jgi:hypothetical protein
MNFRDSYTTKEKLATDPEKEKKKTLLSTDTYALGEQINELITRVNVIIKTK